ncbi:hypothetical protein CHLRE_12g521000v5 [Chlamydomonas reinhardtii]|uniref:Uncharacterized protein n=1 Tax=Chlamydomonas reinhardtii TaxID=3055 RepID=A8J5X5_CHLRE|nr:uncharacterized protein CHLRE_12g521000v5 [Chlamydomonas reinhardtii]PNW75293.1 hypothetical protein CHLRE_12g521000v5 [Chlamydomonas reinhardtii]|eukprot:XP_001696920.1 predicted protein [Chlamydomonas reinhardtii]
MASIRCLAATSGRCPVVAPSRASIRAVRPIVCAAATVPAAERPRVQGQAGAPATTTAEYAVIQTTSGQQLVEEGKWFVLSSGSIQASVDDGQLRFPCLSVKRADGEFVRGKEAAQYVVEAKLLDEQAFEVASGKTRSMALGKVMVTKIGLAEESRRLLEEALRA